jgi:hypothetical protein
VCEGDPSREEMGQENKRLIHDTYTIIKQPDKVKQNRHKCFFENGIISAMGNERVPKNVRTGEAKTEQLTYAGAHIPLASINVLPQPRQTFENIDHLAQNIAKNNLLHPLIVAKFPRKGAQAYLDSINQMWERDHDLTELSPTTEEGEDTYYILLAGERRFRACRHLNTVGCFECQEEYGAGPCYERHFGNNGVDVRLAQDIEPIQAILIQASENIHMRVPTHQEAHFYYLLYRTLSESEPNYPVTRFAREVGRSPDTIRSAIKYCLLPKDIQKYVEDGLIPYGVAGEIARLKSELSLEDEELTSWAVSAVVNNNRVPEFRDKVTNHINQQQSGQGMLAIFSVNQEEEMKRRARKDTIAKEITNVLWGNIAYFKRILKLFETGVLGSEDSPFSTGSPVRIYKALIDIEQDLLPHMRGLLTQAEQDHAESVLRATQDILGRFPHPEDGEMTTVSFPLNA